MIPADVSATVTHFVAVKIVRISLETMGVEVLLVAWVGSVVTAPRVKMVIDVPIELVAAVIPGAGADEHSAVEPLRTVVSVGGAAIRRVVVIAVRTNRRGSDADGNLSRGGCCSAKKSSA